MTTTVQDGIRMVLRSPRSERSPLPADSSLHSTGLQPTVSAPCLLLTFSPSLHRSGTPQGRNAFAVSPMLTTEMPRVSPMPSSPFSPTLGSTHVAALTLCHQSVPHQPYSCCMTSPINLPSTTSGYVFPPWVPHPHPHKQPGMGLCGSD